MNKQKKITTEIKRPDPKKTHTWERQLLSDDSEVCSFIPNSLFKLEKIDPVASSESSQSTNTSIRDHRKGLDWSQQKTPHNCNNRNIQTPSGHSSLLSVSPSEITTVVRNWEGLWKQGSNTSKTHRIIGQLNMIATHSSSSPLHGNCHVQNGEDKACTYH